MPFIPYDTQDNVVEQNKPQENILNTLFPRSSKYVGNIASTGVDVMGQLGDIFKGQFGSQEEKKLAGKGFMEKQKKIEGRKKEIGFEGVTPTLKTADMALGSAGEVAPFFFGVPEAKVLPKEASALSRVINRVVPFTKFGAATGITHGVTTPEAPIEERIGKSVSEGVSGSITGTTLGIASELLKPIFNILKGAGKGITRKVVQPEVGEGPGWATRAGKATETLLEKTKKTDITPARLDKSIEQTLSNTTKFIKSHLGQITDEFDMSDIEEVIYKDLSKSVPTYTSKTISRSLKSDLGETVSTLQGILDEHSIHLKTGGSSITPSNLFSAKQSVGNYLKEPGNVFYKMARNQPLDRTDKLQLAFYNSLKNIVNDMSKKYSNSGLDISELTQMESELFQASAGVQRLGEKPFSKVSPFGWEKLPILSAIISALESTELAAGRTLYETGKVGQKAIESKAVPNIIKTIIAGLSAKNE